MHTLHQPQVATLLDELFLAAQHADGPILASIQTLAPPERAALRADYKRMYAVAKDAYLPVSRAAGELLYALARARGAQCMVEFGTSFGISTIYLAKALQDGGGGSLITTELEPGKAARAQRNLARAGVAELVECRVGDALDTLAELPDGIDFVYLDGAKTLYLDVLRLLEPRLAERAVIVADNIDMTDVVAAYTDYVRHPANGYISSRVVVGEGMEITVRTV